MKLNEIVRKQWNQAAESYTTFVRAGKNYYSDYMNGPALKRMIGEVERKKMLDIGCGEGSFSRFFAEAGAKVTGVDISDRLIEKAVEKEKSHPLGVEYIVADAADLPMLKSKSFDIAFSHMALMDIPDYQGAIAESSRVLKIGGRFVAVIEHPCFEAYRVLNGEAVSGWKKRRENRSEQHVYFWIKDYNTRHSYTWEWKHDRLTSSFVTTGFHRTLSDYVNAMTMNQLAVVKFDEPQPLEQGVRLDPHMKKHHRIPHTIAVGAIKLKN